LVLRRLLGNIAPGATPQKRKAPDGAIDGQIQRPGPAVPAVDRAAPAPAADPPSKKKKKAAKALKAAAPASSSSDDGSDASSSEGDAAVDTVVIDTPSRLARMPAEVGPGPEFLALVAARCANLKSWLPIFSGFSASADGEQQPLLHSTTQQA
jgi:hypothetical protein